MPEDMELFASIYRVMRAHQASAFPRLKHLFVVALVKAGGKRLFQLAAEAQLSENDFFYTKLRQGEELGYWTSEYKYGCNRIYIARRYPKGATQ